VAWVADDPKTGDKFLAVFNAQDQIKIDESKALWKSGTITSEMPSQSIDFDLNITGVKKLYLAVSNVSDEFSRHHADWIQPVLYNEKDSIRLTDIKWVSATSGKESTLINKSVSNKALTVDNKEFTNGIGTYANSIIEFKIPEGFTRFKAKAGLDIDAVKQEFFGGNAKFLVYTQDPSGPMPADAIKIPVNLEQIGISGTCTITDVWNNQSLGTFSKEFAPVIKRHASGLYRISIKK
jgi:uncharacterized protein YdhG (YjbR/CyaY superfamily)